MKRAALALFLALSDVPYAQAFRPFDGTDAAVAPAGALEFEVGYADLLREGSRRSLSAPGLVLNAGIAPGSELVAEGAARTRIGGDGPSGTVVEDVAISWKMVLRSGALQDAPGPSIASECKLLAPAAAGERTGAGCAGIVSRRFSRATLHFNAGLFKDRDGLWERSLGVIVEAPAFNEVEPVFEVSMTSRSDGRQARSALAGVIVSLAKNLTFDLGWRLGRAGNSRLSELRAGFTWSPRQ